MFAEHRGIRQFIFIVGLLRSQFHKIHAVPELHDIGDLVIGIEFSILLFRQRIRGENDAFGRIAVINRITSFTLVILIAAEYLKLIPNIRILCI